MLVLGLDATSRLAAVREMPKLLRVLTDPPFLATPLLGYNTVLIYCANMLHTKIYVHIPSN